jgi:hypothetical protein
MTDDRLIQRLRAANPVATEPSEDDELLTSILATPGDARWRESATRSRRGYSWRYVVPAGGVVVVAGAAAAIAFVALPGGAAITPTSAVGAVLNRAAAAAQAAPPTTLGSGQYLYSDVHELAGACWFWGSDDPAKSACTDQQQTVQTWVAADGSARRLTTYDGPQQFVTPANRAGWVLAGEPSIAPETNTPSGQYDDQSGPGSFPAPDDLSQLPTDPTELTQLIDSGKTGLLQADFDPHVPSTPASTFISAAEILATPALGSDPALRAALYQVMADVPGIELLGSATDQSGRTGTEIAGPLGDPLGDPAGWSRGGDAVRNEVIIDPSDGDVLEINQVIVNPSAETSDFARQFGDTAGELLNWTDYLAAGVVNSTSSTTPVGTAPVTGASGATNATGVSGATNATGASTASGSGN